MQHTGWHADTYVTVQSECQDYSTQQRKRWRKVDLEMGWPGNEVAREWGDPQPLIS